MPQKVALFQRWSIRVSNEVSIVNAAKLRPLILYLNIRLGQGFVGWFLKNPTFRVIIKYCSPRGRLDMTGMLLGDGLALPILDGFPACRINHG